ncbi:homocysteine S-methyltransferase family protein [Leucobacter sp. G161]|uniref:homocysteine S-methyltransferase family protein n=1 Tax=Leucobacter sp. G161 TaxID=663704 RepID=UPI00073C41F7|nr:homocysteine S-methyltransferase family protein [Leucobacter sp. G161]KUF05836.1 homocysteine methyltransferase [Leucobacter sp. G161]
MTTEPAQVASAVMLADGGIETALETRLGQVLPEFAAFVLLDTAEGRDALREYYRPFVELGVEARVPLVLDTPTWRANPDWVELVDGADAAVPTAERVRELNTDAVSLVRECALRLAPDAAIEVNGVVGPRFDDFEATQRMTAESAEQYHGPQVRALAEAGADRITAVTTLDAAEGIGVVRAAVAARVPVAVSFIVGPDGMLADGSTLAAAIAAVDEATGGAALGFAVNCAHPDEVLSGIDPDAPEMGRILGFRLNAARHGDDGPGDGPEAFAGALMRLATLVPSAGVFGGCCGTDAPHIAAVLAGARRSA